MEIIIYCNQFESGLNICVNSGLILKLAEALCEPTKTYSVRISKPLGGGGVSFHTSNQ